jgi:polar amino acid transport system substrate-binding protein
VRDHAEDPAADGTRVGSRHHAGGLQLGRQHAIAGPGDGGPPSHVGPGDIGPGHHGPRHGGAERHAGSERPAGQDPRGRLDPYLDSFLDDNQKLDGFDVKTAEEVAKRLGAMYGKDLAIDWKTPSWDLITAGNWGGRWDISIGSMSVTKSRAKVVDFADPYYYDFGGIAIPKDSTVTSLDQLAGKTFCVGSSTTYEQWLSGTLEIVDPNMLQPPAGVQVTPLETDNLCVQAVQSGRKFDAIAANANGIADWVKSGLPVKLLDIGPIFTVSVSFAMDRSGPSTADILPALNKIVADMHSDGTLSKLSLQYLSRDVTIKP